MKGFANDLIPLKVHFYHLMSFAVESHNNNHCLFLWVNNIEPLLQIAREQNSEQELLDQLKQKKADLLAQQKQKRDQRLVFTVVCNLR